MHVDLGLMVAIAGPVFLDAIGNVRMAMSQFHLTKFEIISNSNSDFCV